MFLIFTSIGVIYTRHVHAIKKQGVPWDCFLSYRFRINYGQAMS